MNTELSTTILRDDDQPYIPLTLPGTEGVAVKVIKVDEENRRVVVKVRFSPGSSMPRHTHHCRAFAYTLSGEWEYDNGQFSAGMIAYENAGENHVPSSTTGAEMVILFDSDSDRWLDNHMPDGSIVHMGMRFFKAMEKVTLEDAAQLDVLALLDITPAAA